MASPDIRILPSGSYEGGFLLIAFADADKVIGTSQVEFAEDAGVTEYFSGMQELEEVDRQTLPSGH